MSYTERIHLEILTLFEEGYGRYVFTAHTSFIRPPSLTSSSNQKIKLTVDTGV